MLPEANRAVAVGLEESDAEMPNATVLFPVSEKPNPKGASMTPVTFNHQAHVDKIDDCTACHHTGDMVACSTCHTVEGKAEGNFITLERAMHATKIAPRKDGVTNAPAATRSSPPSVTPGGVACAMWSPPR